MSENRATKNTGEWETSSTITYVGEADSYDAAWYLTKNRIWPLASLPYVGKIMFGVALFVIIVAMVVLSPSAESHFIYVDF
jgi:hypothetical protein